MTDIKDTTQIDTPLEEVQTIEPVHDTSTETKTSDAVEVATSAPVQAAPASPYSASTDQRTFRKNPRPDRGGDRRGPKREPKPKPEFDQKIVDIRRVTRVTSGGRKFSFAVAVIAGDKKGRVGFGTGNGFTVTVALAVPVQPLVAVTVTE